jgi:hypothetical protein
MVDKNLINVGWLKSATRLVIFDREAQWGPLVRDAKLLKTRDYRPLSPLA